MIIMAVDLGKARTGIAVSDKNEGFAFPKGVITEYNAEKLVDKISEKAKELRAELIVVGLPKNMNGTIGERALECEKIALEIERISGIETRLYDERCTTVTAHNYLNMTDTRGKKRKQVVDTVAATIILEDFLAARKNKRT